MPWIWTYETDTGTAAEPERSQEFPTQADAESWLGETWRELRESGIAAVSLQEDDRVVYGPMPLDA